MRSFEPIEQSSSIAIASEDNAYEKLWFLWRHVKIKKCKSCIINHIPRLKCLIFLCFWFELCKTLEKERQEIKISTRMKKFHFWVKICCFYQKRKWIFEQLWFLVHMVQWPYSTSVPNFRTIWSISTWFDCPIASHLYHILLSLVYFS